MVKHLVQKLDKGHPEIPDGPYCHDAMFKCCAHWQPLEDRFGRLGGCCDFLRTEMPLHGLKECGINIINKEPGIIKDLFGFFRK